MRVAKRSNTPQGGSLPSPDNTYIAKLRSARALLDESLISEADYAAIKQRMLAELAGRDNDSSHNEGRTAAAQRDALSQPGPPLPAPTPDPRLRSVRSVGLLSHAAPKRSTTAAPARSLQRDAQHNSTLLLPPPQAQLQPRDAMAQGRTPSPILPRLRPQTQPLQQQQMQSGALVVEEVAALASRGLLSDFDLYRLYLQHIHGAS